MKKIYKYGILIFGVLILIGFALRGNITHEKFDSEKWKKWKESETEWTMRWDMMNSLRNNYELKGMTKAEIIELLGKPARENNSVFSYSLGPSKRGINYGYLELLFDEMGKVINFKVWDG